MANFMIDIVGLDESNKYRVLRSVGFKSKESAFDYCAGYNSTSRVTMESFKAIPRGNNSAYKPCGSEECLPPTPWFS